MSRAAGAGTRFRLGRRLGVAKATFVFCRDYDPESSLLHRDFSALLLLRKTLSTMNSFPPDCEKGVHYLVVSVIAQPVESL